jgi:hypothetical protein
MEQPRQVVLRANQPSFWRDGQRQAIEVSTLIAAGIAVVIAVGSLIYTLNKVGALQDRITALEKAAQTSQRVSP